MRIGRGLTRCSRLVTLVFLVPCAAMCGVAAASAVRGPAVTGLATVAVAPEMHGQHASDENDPKPVLLQKLCHHLLLGAAARPGA
jgi:hypothetical protein